MSTIAAAAEQNNSFVQEIVVSNRPLLDRQIELKPGESSLLILKPLDIASKLEARLKLSTFER